MSEKLPQIIDALGLEIAAIFKKGGGAQIELRGGERIGQAEKSWLYRFLVTEDVSLTDDTPIRVTAGQDDEGGIVVSFRDGVLLIALERDLGSKIVSARLIANDAFLIERLKEKLQEVQNGEAPFNRSAAERVLSAENLRTAETNPHPLIFEDGSLNEDQIRAVRRSLGSETIYVWGPPGTGKTTTLARIVEAHYRSGRSVLLVSNTNIAVDTALERVAERLKRDPEFQQGLVLRYGPIVKEELRRRFGPQIILEEVVQRLAMPLRHEKEAFIREADALSSDKQSLLGILKDLKVIVHIRETLSLREQQLTGTKAKLSSRKSEAEQCRTALSQLRNDLERSKTMGRVRRFFSGLNPEKLAQKIRTAELAQADADKTAEAVATELSNLQSKIGSLRGSIEILLAKTRNQPSLHDVQNRIMQIDTRLDQIRDQVAALDKKIEELEKQTISKCKIFATTVYRTYLSKNIPNTFDSAVIDEVSMLPPPLVYYAAGLANQSVTVAGDFRQLPPIVISNEKLAEKWLKCDVFEKAGIPGLIASGHDIPHLVSLTTQYRMREPICAVLNKFFYADRPLRSDPSVELRHSNFPLSETSLLYVNTAPFHPWAALRVGSYSRYNFFHALLCRNIILHLAETGFLPAEGAVNNAVGAVAPYASQARLIQALLDDRIGKRAAGIAATVHRFQGNEKAAMILDLTDSFGVRLSRFLQATTVKETGARLLNVALSRAQKHVILIGNFEYLRSKSPREGFVRRLVDHFEDQGEPLNLDVLLPLAESDWVDGLHRMLPKLFEFPENGSGAFTEGTFYPAFLHDLKRVSKSIVIFSPFATANGTSRWIEPLRGAIGRGVQVRILTRPPAEYGGLSAGEVGEMVSEIRRIGVIVDLRARMHEKIAILDGRVLWHGSLNILSHRDTHESMLRIASPIVCQELVRFISTPRGRRENAPNLDAVENPTCPICGGPTVWNLGRYGIWFECEKEGCNGRIDHRGDGRRRRSMNNSHNVPSNNAVRPSGQSTANGNERACPEPGCDGQLVVRNGRYGRFWGCTNYPRCRHTENLR